MDRGRLAGIPQLDLLAQQIRQVRQFSRASGKISAIADQGTRPAPEILRSRQRLFDNHLRVIPAGAAANGLGQISHSRLPHDSVEKDTGIITPSSFIHKSVTEKSLQVMKSSPFGFPRLPVHRVQLSACDAHTPARVRRRSTHLFS